MGGPARVRPSSSRQPTAGAQAMVLVALEQDRRAAAVTRRREQIARTAAKVFATKGVGNTTMRDIAAEAGILAGSLYHHFESKEALLEEILRGVLTDLAHAYDKVREANLDTEASVERLLLVGLQFVTDHHDVTAIVQNDYTYLHDVDAFRFVEELSGLHWQSWHAVLERGVAAGELRADLDLELAYRSMMASIVSEVRWRRDNPRRPDAAQLAAQYSRLYLLGLAAS
jgi:TetR/AcrR family transcriptional regulator, cholesterol catabolism regulator